MKSINANENFIKKPKLTFENCSRTQNECDEDDDDDDDDETMMMKLVLKYKCFKTHRIFF
jgi:hypothetical protein